MFIVFIIVLLYNVVDVFVRGGYNEQSLEQNGMYALLVILFCICVYLVQRKKREKNRIGMTVLIVMVALLMSAIFEAIFKVHIQYFFFGMCGLEAIGWLLSSLTQNERKA